MKKWLPAVIISAVLLAGNAFMAAAEDTEEIPAVDSAETVEEIPQVTFGEWGLSGLVETSQLHVRDVYVSDGGNYLMTSREHNTAHNSYFYRYTPIYQGYGVQSYFGENMDETVIDEGKLLRYETMEECGFEIEQTYNGFVKVQTPETEPFILIFRPDGGLRDGLIETVKVVDGIGEISGDSYEGIEAIELLGVFRFPEKDRKALTFGPNVVKESGGGFKIQQVFSSDEPDGIAMISYTNSSGNDVHFVEAIFDGVGVITAYDKAQTEEEMQTGHFEVLGFAYHYTDAVFH